MPNVLSMSNQKDFLDLGNSDAGQIQPNQSETMGGGEINWGKYIQNANELCLHQCQIRGIFLHLGDSDEGQI